MAQAAEPQILINDSVESHSTDSIADSPTTPTKSVAGKIGANHNLFMINMDSPPKLKNQNKTAPINLTASTTASSTKVIESLHEQIDTLTNTNLQLTIQSHGLLEKLDSAQQKESQLQENISSLKHENENVNSMLNRKTRRLKDVEEELASLKKKVDFMVEENESLKEKFQMSSETEVKLNSQIELYKSQYDAVVDSQQYYRDHYNKEVSELKEQIEILKKSQITQLQKITDHHNLMDEKLNNFDTKHASLHEAQEKRLELLDVKCQEAITDLDLPSWIELYKKTKSTFVEYSNEMEIEVSDKFKDIARDQTLTALEGKFNNVSEEQNQTIPNSNGTIRNNKQRESFVHRSSMFFSEENNNYKPTNTNRNILKNHSIHNNYFLNNNSNSHVSSVINPKMGNNSNTNGNNTIKRKSFYGASMPLANVTNSHNGGTQSSLPGIKRSGSVKRANMNRRSVSASDKNNMPNTQRHSTFNPATASHRRSQTATFIAPQIANSMPSQANNGGTGGFRKNRGSMMFQ